MPSHVLLCKRFRENGKLLKFVGDLTKLVCLLLLQYILVGLGEVVL